MMEDGQSFFFTGLSRAAGGKEGLPSVGVTASAIFVAGLVGHAVRAVTWIAQAQDRDHWRQLEDEYVAFCRRGHRR